MGLDPRRTYAYALSDLHPDVEHARALFRDGHFPEAVRNAAQAFINRVGALIDPVELERRSGRRDLDGTPLLEVAFGEDQPLLAFSSRETRTQRSEHLGYRDLRSGALACAAECAEP